MFEQHFHLKENPFAAGHQPRFVYPSREHQEAIAHLRYGVENHEPFVLITGEVGTGKTTAVFNALNQLSQKASVALITNSALNRVELLEEICLRFGMQLEGRLSKPQLLAQLERHLSAVHARGDRSVLIVDEAQNLSRDLLEEIRLLSNLESQGDSMLQIFLVGQPELSTRLLQPELRQLRQRITVRYRLRPLDGEETEHYIHHRISVAGGNAWQIFPAIACRVVFDLTGGVPREINTVASQALLNAFVDDARYVEPRHVQSVASEMGFESVVGAQEKAISADDTVVPDHADAPPQSTAAAAAPTPPVATTTPPEVQAREVTRSVDARGPQPDDDWEPPVAQVDEPSPSYPDMGVDDIYAEVETVTPRPEAPAVAPAAADPEIEAIGEDLPAEPLQGIAEAERAQSIADTPYAAPLGNTRLVDDVPETPPRVEAEPVRELPEDADDEAYDEAYDEAPAPVSAQNEPPTPSPRPEVDIPWVEPDFSGPKSKPDLLAALRTELQQKYEDAVPAAAPPPEPEAAATMLANLEHPKPTGPEVVVPAVDYMPARLRARLEEIEREQARPRRRLDGYAIAWMALIGVAIIVAVIVWSRLRHAPAGGQRTGAAIAEPQAPASDPSASKPAPSTGATAIAGTAAAKATNPPEPSTRADAPAVRPATTAKKPSPPSTNAIVANATPPVRAFGVQVAVFLTQEKAMEEQVSLSRLAGRSGRVLHADGDTWYRVVIGEFSNADSAARAGEDIVRHGWVDDYVVVPVEPATAVAAPAPR